MLVKRDTGAFANSLVAVGKKMAQYYLRYWCVGHGISTISMLMLICGFVFVKWADLNMVASTT